MQKGASQTCVFRGLKEIAMGVVLLLFTRFDLGMYSFGKFVLGFENKGCIIRNPWQILHSRL